MLFFYALVEWCVVLGFVGSDTESSKLLGVITLGRIVFKF